MAKNDAANAAQSTSAAVATAVTTDPEHHLIVIHPFGTYSKGMRIDDANEIATVLAGENAGSCNRVKANA